MIISNSSSCWRYSSHIPPVPTILVHPQDFLLHACISIHLRDFYGMYNQCCRAGQRCWSTDTSRYSLSWWQYERRLHQLRCCWGGLYLRYAVHCSQRSQREWTPVIHGSNLLINLFCIGLTSLFSYKSFLGSLQKSFALNSFSQSLFLEGHYLREKRVKTWQASFADISSLNTMEPLWKK